MFSSLWPHGLQGTMLPCPSLSTRVYSNSCPQSWWHYPTISSSVTSFSCPQFFPAPGSFPMSQILAWGGQSIAVSASASVLPINIQGWFPLGLTGLISLLSKGLPRVFFNIRVQKHQFFSIPPSLWSSFHIQYITSRKTIALIIWTFVSKVMSLLFNMLSRLIIAFLPSSSVF